MSPAERPLVDPPQGREDDRPLPDVDRGGEPACYAHLVCPECGAVLDAGAHAAGCSDEDE